MKSDRIKSWPKNERPRERLLANGAEALTDAELLAVILRVGQGTFKEGVAGLNATAFAKQILKEFNGLRGVDRAHVEELAKVHGLGPAKIAQIKAAIEIGRRVQAKPLRAQSFETSASVAAHFRPKFTNARHEKVIAMLLNGQNQLIAEKTRKRTNDRAVKIPIHPVLHAMLKELGETGNGGKGYLFPEEAKLYQERRHVIVRMIQEHFQKCGIQTTEAPEGKDIGRCPKQISPPRPSFAHSTSSGLRVAGHPSPLLRSAISNRRFQIPDVCKQCDEMQNAVHYEAPLATGVVNLKHVSLGVYMRLFSSGTILQTVFAK